MRFNYILCLTQDMLKNIDFTAKKFSLSYFPRKIQFFIS